MKSERKHMIHLLDAAFDLTYKGTDYKVLGADLEELNTDLSPDVETKQNILGENSVVHNGYEASTDADPFYYDGEDALSQKVMDIALGRLTGDACKTSYVEVLYKVGANGGQPTQEAAWREDVLVIPNSYGGDTSGVQVPFTIHHAGNRVKGTFDMSTMKFTVSGSGL